MSVATAGLILTLSPLASAATTTRTGSCTIGGVRVSQTIKYDVAPGANRAQLLSVAISIPSGVLDYWVYTDGTYDTGLKRASGRSVTLAPSTYGTIVTVYGGNANDGLPMCQVGYNMIR